MQSVAKLISDFRNAVCVRFDFVFTYLLRQRVCIDSWNVNNKYCIDITSVKQTLQPVDYAWWQKQHTMFTLCQLYVCLVLLQATIYECCILCSVL